MTARATRSITWRRHALGVTWVILAAAAAMAPALVHGVSLGPFDLLSRYGLSSRSGVVVHDPLSSDQINAFIPWTNLAWTQVHHGQLPLWNPYSALGMPLAFNWQSAPFSVAAAVGYLFPLHLAYTAQVLVTLVIAGMGVYVLGRVLGLGVLGCTMAATVYELSGPFMGWLGWPVATVMSFAGWLFAAAILVVRGRRRAAAVSFFALVLALAIYAGQPETLIELLVGLVVFLVVVLALRVPALGGSGPIRRPVVDVVIAAVAGSALGAPLALPGVQVASVSVRRGVGFYGELPLHDVAHVIFQGFDGLPVAGSRWFGGVNYVESAAYVGVIAVVLAVVAIGTRRRQADVLAFGAVALSAAALTFVAPVVAVAHSLPVLGLAQWHRDVVTLAFALAALAGVGTDVLVRSHANPAVRSWAVWGFAASAGILALVWLVGRGHLHPVQAGIRARSFIWPAVQTVLGLAVVGALVVGARSGGGHRRRRSHLTRWAVVSLLVCETAFLVSAGAPIWSSSPTYLTPTPAELTLQRAVGSSVVGFGQTACLPFSDIGILPNVNLVYGIHELAVYDPALPIAYFDSWTAATGKPGGVPFFKSFCPGVTSATLARRYGVGFVLEPPRTAGPRGAVFDLKVGNEKLYRVPGAAAATVVPLTAVGDLPGPDAAGRSVDVSHPGPAEWRLSTDATVPSVLRLRLTDVPGWQATLDGRQLPLARFAGVMFQARVPAGHHVVELHYWPATFTVGLVLAGCAVVGLGTGLVVSRRRRRVGE